MNRRQEEVSETLKCASYVVLVMRSPYSSSTDFVRCARAAGLGESVDTSSGSSFITLLNTNSVRSLTARYEFNILPV